MIHNSKVVSSLKLSESIWQIIQITNISNDLKIDELDLSTLYSITYMNGTVKSENVTHHAEVIDSIIMQETPYDSIYTDSQTLLAKWFTCDYDQLSPLKLLTLLNQIQYMEYLVKQGKESLFTAFVSEFTSAQEEIEEYLTVESEK